MRQCSTTFNTFQITSLIDSAAHIAFGRAEERSNLLLAFALRERKSQQESNRSSLLPQATRKTSTTISVFERYWYYVYIMTNRSRTLYIGVTSNLERRVYKHKHKLVPGFTRRYNMTELVYFEVTTDVYAAISREKQLKGWLRSKKIALIEQENPLWIDMGISILDKVHKYFTVYGGACGPEHRFSFFFGGFAAKKERETHVSWRLRPPQVPDCQGENRLAKPCLRNVMLIEAFLGKTR